MSQNLRILLSRLLLIGLVCALPAFAAAIVAARLVNMGGALFSWTPESGMTPAKALFRFQTRAARDEFLVRMAQIPGVSIATVQ